MELIGVKLGPRNELLSFQGNGCKMMEKVGRDLEFFLFSIGTWEKFEECCRNNSRSFVLRRRLGVDGIQVWARRIIIIW